MPIHGLTDRGGALPRLGVLRKGAPKVSERQPGRDLGDHFRLDTPYPDVLEHFRQLYGPKPNHIRVLLLHATPEANFQAWKEHHRTGALVRRCDGQTCVQRLCTDGHYDVTPTTCICATELSQADPKQLCRPVGRLDVVLPELQRLGSVLVATTSIHDIIELQQNLTMIAALRGDLRGIPLVLSRRPRKVSMLGDDGKRRRVEKWLLVIEPAPDWVRLQLSAMERRALPEPLAIAQLPEPAPAVDATTGELFDDDEGADEPTAPLATLRGPLAELDARYNGGGTLYVRGTVGGQAFLAKDAQAEQLHDYEVGSHVQLTGVYEASERLGRVLVVDRVRLISVPTDMPPIAAEYDQIDAQIVAATDGDDLL